MTRRRLVIRLDVELPRRTGVRSVDQYVEAVLVARALHHARLRARLQQRRARQRLRGPAEAALAEWLLLPGAGAAIHG